MVISRLSETFPLFYERDFFMSENKNTQRIKSIVVLAMFAALAFVIELVFRIRVAGFLTFDAKDAVITIGSLFYGPLSGIIISLVISFIEMITISTTGIWGFIMNFVSTAAFAGVASLIYKKNRTLNGALIGLAAGSASMVVLMMIMNLIITPIYTGMTVQAVADMILPILLPFNLAKVVLNSAFVLLLYKPIFIGLKAAHLAEGEVNFRFDKKTVIVAVLGFALVAVALVVFFVVLGAKLG